MNKLLTIGALLGLVILAAVLQISINGCAHADAGKFATCMKDSSAGAALINATNDILDGDNRTQVLEQLAIVVGPEALKCALEQIASKLSAGPVGDTRSKRAREYLDSHGGRAGICPYGICAPPRDRIAGICPYGICAPSRG